MDAPTRSLGPPKEYLLGPPNLPTGRCQVKAGAERYPQAYQRHRYS